MEDTIYIALVKYHIQYQNVNFNGYMYLWLSDLNAQFPRYPLPFSSPPPLFISIIQDVDAIFQ